MDSPSEMTLSPNTFWLTFFSGNKYIAVLYDSAGCPKYCYNEKRHTHGYFIKTLMQYSLFEAYNIPAEGDLNKVFEHDMYEFMRNGIDNMPPGEITESLAFKISRLPSFPSTNLVDRDHLNRHLVTNLPLTNVIIVKLNRNEFMGIIRFEIVQPHKEERAATAVTDEKGRIVVVNKDFAALLKESNPEKILDISIMDVVRFNSIPFYFDKTPAIPIDNGKRHAWTHESGSPFPFQPAFGNFSENQSTNIFTCDEGKARTFLAWQNRLDIDKNDFDIGISFEVVTGGYPSVILRANDEAENEDESDIAGISVSFDPIISSMVFKAREQVVACYRVPFPKPNSRHTFNIFKRNSRYELLFDGNILGQVHFPAILPSDKNNSIILFLRSETCIRFMSFYVNYVPCSTENAIKPLIATVERSGTANHYNVIVEQRTMRMQNVLQFRFNDMTLLYNDLLKLREEKDKLSGLVRGRGKLIGNSPAITAIREQLPRLSSSGLAILIEGETGTGKEILARALHEESARSDKPFVKIDCSAIPQTLMESELFGFEKGAFTGARERHKGRFEQADGGTVFIDEISNLSLSVQAKLLGVLQDYRIQRIGGTKSFTVDVRVICASNVPIAELMARGFFRPDLYYRLNQIRLVLPPLRERIEDVQLLANKFVEEASTSFDRYDVSLTRESLRKLSGYSWPGNIRELRNVIYRTVMLSGNSVIDAKDMEMLGQNECSEKRASSEKGKKRVQKEDFIKAVREYSGNISRIAKHLSISRIAVYQRIKSLGLDIGGYRS